MAPSKRPSDTDLLFLKKIMERERKFSREVNLGTGRVVRMTAAEDRRALEIATKHGLRVSDALLMGKFVQL